MQKHSFQNIYPRIMSKSENIKSLSRELREVSKEDIARTNALLEKLAIIEYEIYKQAA